MSAVEALDVDAAEDLLSGPNHIATIDLAEHRHYVRQMIVYMDDDLQPRGFIYLCPKTETSLDDDDRWEAIPVATFPVRERQVVSRTFERVE